jgi:hypothetical protein
MDPNPLDAPWKMDLHRYMWEYLPKWNRKYLADGIGLPLGNSRNDCFCLTIGDHWPIFGGFAVSPCGMTAPTSEVRRLGRLHKQRLGTTQPVICLKKSQLLFYM